MTRNRFRQAGNRFLGSLKGLQIRALGVGNPRLTYGYRGGQRYFFWGCAFARMLPFFYRPLALDRNDFKFASALGAIPL